MAYGDWTINGTPINWIIDVQNDPLQRTLTFHCLADVNATGADPRIEIDSIQSLACQVINNTQLLNGGSKLQVRGGSTVTITEKNTTAGDISYKAAIEGVVIKENNIADQVIEYNIVAHYETSGAETSKIYVPSYADYSNINYYYWYYPNTEGTWIKEDASWHGPSYGTEIGYMTIVETKQVKKVEVYGSACFLPGSLTVEESIESTQNWNYHHDPDPVTGVAPNEPFQKLTFNFAEGNYPTILNFHTTEHNPDNTTAHNHGCWLKWIKVTFV